MREPGVWIVNPFELLGMAVAAFGLLWAVAHREITEAFREIAADLRAWRSRRRTTLVR